MLRPEHELLTQSDLRGSKKRACALRVVPSLSGLWRAGVAVQVLAQSLPGDQTAHAQQQSVHEQRPHHQEQPRPLEEQRPHDNGHSHHPSAGCDCGPSPMPPPADGCAATAGQSACSARVGVARRDDGDGSSALEDCQDRSSGTVHQPSLGETTEEPLPETERSSPIRQRIRQETRSKASDMEREEARGRDDSGRGGGGVSVQRDVRVGAHPPSVDTVYRGAVAGQGNQSGRPRHLCGNCGNGRAGSAESHACREGGSIGQIDAGDGGREGGGYLEQYDCSRSTEETYRADHRIFTERFREARSLLDYSYHSNYVISRQEVQDRIIEDALRTSLWPEERLDVDGYGCNGGEGKKRQRGYCQSSTALPDRPWAVFTAGAMGAGKSHVMRLLEEEGIFPMTTFVQVDPDRLRRELPEMEAYLRRDQKAAGSLTHKEAGLMAEILEETALLDGRNILVDGSLRDGEWYALHIKDLRKRFPRLRVAIIHVWAPEEEVMARAARRAAQTGRVIPPSILRDTVRAVPGAVERVAPLADYCVRIDNSGGNDPAQTALTVSFRESKCQERSDEISAAETKCNKGNFRAGSEEFSEETCVAPADLEAETNCKRGFFRVGSKEFSEETSIAEEGLGAEKGPAKTTTAAAVTGTLRATSLTTTMLSPTENDGLSSETGRNPSKDQKKTPPPVDTPGGMEGSGGDRGEMVVGGHDVVFSECVGRRTVFIDAAGDNGDDDGDHGSSSSSSSYPLLSPSKDTAATDLHTAIASSYCIPPTSNIRQRRLLPIEAGASNAGGEDEAPDVSSATVQDPRVNGLADMEAVAEAEEEGEGERTGVNTCSEATGTLPDGFPVLATPGETWETFRAMFAQGGGGC